VDPTHDVAHTGHMAEDPDTWRAQVREAAVTGRQDELRRLFDQAAAVFGDDASAEWARTLSALDGTAVTG
jgi:hypothetical protein